MSKSVVTSKVLNLVGFGEICCTFWCSVSSQIFRAVAIMLKSNSHFDILPMSNSLVNTKVFRGFLSNMLSLGYEGLLL